MGVLGRVLRWLGLGLLVATAAVGLFVYVSCSRFDASLAKVYDVPPLSVARSADPAILARGEHLVRSYGGCALYACHGADLAGGQTTEMGPVGTFTGPDITPVGVVAAYSDGELARLIRHGIKKDGRSVRFMTSQDLSWIPDADLAAMISYVRTVPPVVRDNGLTFVGTLGKILDRQDQFVWDVARRIDHARVESVPPPAATAQYGAFLSRLCNGCHGEHLSGGPIPGAPAKFAVPLNLTPDASGLRDWSFEEFDRVMRAGVRRNGKQLDALMPIEGWKNLDGTEMRALWEYLRSVPPRPFGQR